MSTLSLLPLIKVTDGVQTNEDWQLSIAFYLEDGVTPIDISGLSFSLAVGAIATLTDGAGQLVVSGPNSNVLIVTALATQTATWPTAVYPISLTVSDGTYTRDMFAFSTLTVGAAQVARVTLVVAPDIVPKSVAAPISSALAAAFQALQPTAISEALTSLSSADLSALMQALMASLPTQSGSIAPVPSGQAFINSSGYVVIAQ